MTKLDVPTVSVVMPAHNAEAYVAEAVASVLHQTYPDFELIVVDDASTDSTAAIVRSFDDRRVHIARMSRQSGPAAARNRGLERARGRFVAFLDADDLAYPKRLATQHEHMLEHPDVALLGAGYDVIDASGRVLATLTDPSGGASVRLRMLFDNVIATSMAFASRDALQKEGGFDERLAVGEDHDMWARVASRYPIARLAEVVGAYREHSTSTYRAAGVEADAVRRGVVCRVIELTVGAEISPGTAQVLSSTERSAGYSLDDSIVALVLLEALPLGLPQVWTAPPSDRAAWAEVLIEKLETVVGKEPALRGQALRSAARMIREGWGCGVLNKRTARALLHLALGPSGRLRVRKPLMNEHISQREAAREAAVT